LKSSILKFITNNPAISVENMLKNRGVCCYYFTHLKPFLFKTYFQNSKTINFKLLKSILRRRSRKVTDHYLKKATLSDTETP